MSRNIFENQDSSDTGIGGFEDVGNDVCKTIYFHLKDNPFFEAIIKNRQDLVTVIDANGNLAYINDSVRHILGYEEIEVIDTNFFQSIHTKDRSKIKEAILSNNGDNNKISHFRIVHKNGHTIYVECYCRFRLSIESKEYQLLVSRDITEGKLKEEQLRTSKAKEQKALSLFKSLYENTPYIIILWKAKYKRPVFSNKKNPLGYNLKKDLERFISFDIVHPEDREEVMQYRAKLFSSSKHQPVRTEFRMKNAHGEWEWVQNADVVMERDDEGFPSLILSSAVVITEFKNIQQKLEDSKARLNALLENTVESIWSVDKELRITAANSQFLSRYPEFCRDKVAIGDPVLKFSSQEDQVKWEGLYRRCLNGERFNDIAEYLVNDTQFYFETSFMPIIENGKIEGVSCFCRDISLLKQSEADLKQLNYELDSFVYRASHDMMAPLKSVLGLVNILKMNLPFVEQEKYLGLIEKSVKKLDVFIHDLTSFSRNSRLPLVGTAIDFKELIDTSFENLVYMENADKIKVRTEISQNCPFYCDKLRLQIIFQNFISNAIKYQRTNIDNPSLAIKVHCDKDLALIEISDNGKGIKKEHLPRIFEVFFRASEESYGSGLGLYITKQAIDKLRGKILNVNSKFGEGTFFKILIPAVNGQH